MIKRLTIIPLILVLSLFVISESQADVLVNDADSRAETNATPFNSADVPTGSGLEGDYELIVCSIPAIAGNNPFSDPTPGVWTELDMGPCGGEGLCAHGIWGRFTDNPASEEITCSWTIDSRVFASGSFRYNEVDPVDPVIDVACDAGNGIGTIATAPSINTIAGSQVVRIYTYLNLDQTETGETNTNTDISGSFTTNAFLASNVNVHGETILVNFDGPTGTQNFDVGTEARWRACTIALRMQPRVIPTMSEWGFIAVAAFMGIAGVWFLRRRQAQGT